MSKRKDSSDEQGNRSGSSNSRRNNHGHDGADLGSFSRASIPIRPPGRQQEREHVNQDIRQREVQEFPQTFVQDFISRILQQLRSIGENVNQPHEANTSGSAVRLEGLTLSFSIVVNNNSRVPAQNIEYQVVLTRRRSNHAEQLPVNSPFRSLIEALNNILAGINWSVRDVTTVRPSSSRR